MITPDRIVQARILVVDDEPANTRLLEQLLGKAGYENYLSTSDPRTVADLYEAFRPDLLLLDLHMPGMDGFEVMQHLSTKTTDGYVPILVLTADPDQAVRIRALESGAKDFLTKPFDPVEVATRIRNLIEVRLLYEDLRQQNVILEQKVRERTEELHQTRLEIIHRLSRAAEFHDTGTGVHIMRMSQYCALVARTAGLSDAQADLVLSASPMHDVGKIGIPDRILLKPSALSAEERAVMQRHTVIGAELLSGHRSTLMRMAATIAYTHHERWDGTGYPRGLAREDIPIEGRIVSLCDVFDALISPRPYKPSWPRGEAVREVNRLSGMAFDPSLVDAFHVALPAIEEIIERVAAREARTA
ncbi:response regulator [Candidatus Fermentibacteria bacterium]|nr:response regulator [Candidatus Fermentibacteria bacterium]